MEEISCGGCLRARGVSRLSPSIEPFRPTGPFPLLEEYLELKGSSESGVFCMDGRS